MQDYSGRHCELIEKYLKANFVVDQRVCYRERFLITEMKHDLIIGLQWLTKLRVKIDPARRKLIWPYSNIPVEGYVEELGKTDEALVSHKRQQRNKNLR